MDLDLVIARLKDTLVGFKQIAGAADMLKAMDGAVTVPAAFVCPLADSAEPSEMLSSHEQRLTEAFGVFLVVPSLRDVTGGAALAELKPMRAQVRQALAGWVPVPDDGEAVQILGGRLLAINDGRLWWSDEFNLKTYYRSL